MGDTAKHGECITLGKPGNEGMVSVPSFPNPGKLGNEGMVSVH